MKELVQRISSTAKSEKAFNWFKLISLTGGAQIVVQGIGLISGIIVIRLLKTEEYGLYTLANTMLGTMTILADGGIASGVMAQGGRVWKDKEKLGVVLATGLDLRRKFAVGSFLVAIPILLYLLRLHGASWLTAIIIMLCLIPAFFTALSGTLLTIVPKLNQVIFPLQKNNVISNIARLILLSFLFVFPWAFVAILAFGIPQIWANMNLRKISAPFANWKQPADLKIRKEILSFVKRILPGDIYYCVSSQLSIWIISWFGTTTNVAKLGALGRLSMLLGLFTTIFTTLVSPRFARLPNTKAQLLPRFLQIMLGFFILSFLIVFAVWLFPNQVLWVLGKNYSNLQSELILNVIGSCLGLISGIAFNIFTSRGWAIHPVITIPINILSVVAGVMLFDISSLIGLLHMSIFVVSIQVVMNGFFCIFKIMRAK